jgi:hypothetical protein
MNQQDDKSFFDRLGEILNSPLSGTQAPQSSAQPEAAAEENPSLLKRVKEILNTPLPGSADAPDEPPRGDQQDLPHEPPVQGSPASPSAQSTVHPGTDSAGAPASQGGQTPELDEDDLDEEWWKQDWAAFRAHQRHERQGLEQKQRGDLAKFAAYQDQEKRRFEAHQQQELNGFRQQQQWRLSAWKQAMAANPGSRPPPPPWGMPGPPEMMPPAGPPMGRPGPMGPLPWMRPPGPRRGR